MAQDAIVRKIVVELSGQLMQHQIKRLKRPAKQASEASMAIEVNQLHARPSRCISKCSNSSFYRD